MIPDIMERVGAGRVVDESEREHACRNRKAAASNEVCEFARRDKARDPRCAPSSGGQHIVHFRKSRKSIWPQVERLQTAEIGRVNRIGAVPQKLLPSPP